jgi:RimJ/RimL family protein N-acetyltransferase
MKPTLSTTRLNLRPVAEEDAQYLCALDAEERVRRFVDQPEAPNLAQCEAVVARMRAIDAATPSLGFWMAEIRGEFVGWFHLKPPRDGEPAEIGDLEIGYRLMPSAWGQGLATEGSRALLRYGFETLRAPRVTAVAFDANTASLRVISKLGLMLWRRWEYRSRLGSVIPCGTYACVRMGDDHSRAGGSCAS